MSLFLSRSFLRSVLSARSLRLTVLALVLASGARLPAQETENAADSGPPAAATLSRPMDLQAVLTGVLDANLRLRANNLERSIARERERAEWAIFEPAFLVTVAEEANRRQNNTEQFLSQRVTVFDEQNRIYSGAIEGTLPTGGKLRVGSQVRDLGNNLQTTAQREWESFSGVTLTQPLLRGGGWGPVAAQIKLAASDSKIAIQEYRRQMALVLSQAELSFWELKAAQELVGTRRVSLRSAETLLADNRNRVANGKMTEIEVLQAEAGLAVRRTDLVDAQQRVTEATALLNSFMGRINEADTAITVSGELASPGEALPLPADAVGEAFANHPVYLAQVQRLEQEKIRLSFARNQRWPQLDLKASYGLNGLGLDVDHTYRAARTRDYTSWYVGLEVRVPLTGGVRERAQVRAAKHRQEQALLELKAIEIEMINAVGALARKAQSQRERAQALSGVVGLNQRLLDVELERLGAGKSESRKVLETEEELSRATVDELASRLDDRRAQVELLVQQGTYLSTRGFELK